MRNRVSAKEKSLTQSVKRLLNLDSFDLIDNKVLQIKKIVNEIADTTHTHDLASILQVRLVRPLYNQICEIANTSMDRSNYKTLSHKKEIAKKYKSLLDSILNDYTSLVKDFGQYKILEQERLEKHLGERDFLISSHYHHKEAYPYGFYFENQYKELLLTNKGGTIEYFTNLFNNTPQHEESKLEVQTYIEKAKTYLAYLRAEHKKHLATDFTKIGDPINHSRESNNYKTHIDVLQQLIKELTRKFVRVAILNSANTTVFGDGDFIRIQRLYNSLIEHGFIEETTSEQDFIDVFSLGKSNDIKINLTKGTLADFGYMIKLLKTKFDNGIDSDTFWSESFTFNNKQKNKESVGKIRTSKERIPQYKNRIETIISTVWEEK